MKFRLLSIFFFAAAVYLYPQTVSIDNFETGVGRFAYATGYSGSTSGIISYQPVQDTLIPAAEGRGSLKVLLIDDPAVTTNYFVRLLSGMGAPANNLVLNDTGYVGYWVKSNRSYVKVSLILDDLNASGSGVGTNELGVYRNLYPDNEWHLYQWTMHDSLQWDPFIASGNGRIQDPVSVDALAFSAPDSLAMNDTATLYIDYVSFNPTAELPVELVAFDSRIDGNNVDLRWITATELNNKGFEIQRRSTDGEYEVLGFVAGKGTTTSPTGYTFRDVVEKPGKYTYRLKQVDFDGTYEYSKAVEVEIIAVPGAYYLTQNYPNPFNPNTSISFHIPQSGMVDLAVYNLIGEKVITLVNDFRENGTYNVNVNADHLSSGTYIYRLNVNGQSFTRKMTLLK